MKIDENREKSIKIDKILHFYPLWGAYLYGVGIKLLVKAIIKLSCKQMLIGTVLVLLFSDPMVGLHFP